MLFAGLFFVKRWVLDKTDWLVIGLLFWAALSLSWSPDQAAGMYGLIKFVAVGVLFMTLRRNRHDLSDYIAVSVVAVLGLNLLVTNSGMS